MKKKTVWALIIYTSFIVLSIQLYLINFERFSEPNNNDIDDQKTILVEKNEKNEGPPPFLISKKHYIHEKQQADQSTPSFSASSIMYPIYNHQIQLESEEKDEKGEENNIDCYIGEINPQHSWTSQIWQIAVPHTGTTTLENVIKSAVQQDFKTRFYNNTKVCSLCSYEEFEYKASIYSTLASGKHIDWFRANSEFQNVNEVC